MEYFPDSINVAGRTIYIYMAAAIFDPVDSFNKNAYKCAVQRISYLLLLRRKKLEMLNKLFWNFVRNPN